MSQLKFFLIFKRMHTILKASCWKQTPTESVCSLTREMPFLSEECVPSPWKDSPLQYERPKWLRNQISTVNVVAGTKSSFLSKVPSMQSQINNLHSVKWESGISKSQSSSGKFTLEGDPPVNASAFTLPSCHTPKEHFSTKELCSI